MLLSVKFYYLKEMHKLNQSARNSLLDGITNTIRNGRASRGTMAELDCLWDVVLAFWLTRRSAWKRVDLLRRDHICQRAFLRFFFQIQLSRLARVPPMLVHAARALSRSSLLPRESRGLFFSSRSIVRPTRRFVPFLFSFSFFLLFSFSSSLFSLFLSSFVPPAHNSSALCLTKQWHKGPAGLTRRAGSLGEQLARILPQFLQYLSSKNR